MMHGVRRGGELFEREPCTPQLTSGSHRNTVVLLIDNLPIP